MYLRSTQWLLPVSMPSPEVLGDTSDWLRSLTGQSCDDADRARHIGLYAGDCMQCIVLGVNMISGTSLHYILYNLGN